MESKFKVGDRVRWTRVPTQFQHAVVCQVCCWPFDYQVAEGGDTTYVYEHELERIASNVSTTIQKGDKFRVNKDCHRGDYSNGDIFETADAQNDGVSFYDHDGDFRFIAHEDVTLVDDHGEPWDHEPRALRIQEGRYYRTRDGRKVGPARKSDDSDFVWDFPEAYYDDDLTAPGLGSGNDLIAEWTDEPVAPAQMKFKVGDRVNYTISRKSWQGITIHKLENNLYYANDPKWGEGAFPESWLEFAEPATIQPGQIVTLQGYVRAINGKTAHIDIIGPDVPYNRSYPLSALRAA